GRARGRRGPTLHRHFRGPAAQPLGTPRSRLVR
ncbi:MAG: hypothetical protein AVDCRST_MAG12-1903, partial [uncultured Rubrobacteraceae bacterium]